MNGVHACVCMRVHACACVCMRVHACACVCMRVHACACVCMRVHACAGVCMRVHACMRAYIMYTFAQHIHPKTILFPRNLHHSGSYICATRLAIKTCRKPAAAHTWLSNNIYQQIIV